MSHSPKNRGQFTSSLGFILASAGSAIGLGNLWKFPYIAGKSGGGIFLVFYLVFVILLGLPIMMSEMAIGRKTQLNAIGAYRKLDKRWSFVGVLGVLCAFVILSYYSVVGGWVLKYIAAYATGGNFGGDTSAYFNNFVSQPWEPVIWHLVFMALCALVVVMGVVKGIEKVSKLMLPALFVLVIVIAVRAVTLPGASEGLKFLFVPNFAAVSSLKDLGNAMVQAMGQVFFSLSLGMGITITYGSYLKKDSNIVKNTGIVVGLDSLIAILAGCAILPAVFAFGFEPSAGAGLVFTTLPAVFADMPLGTLFGLLFFILVLIAAATSAISLLEVVAAYFIDNFHWSRKKATIIMSALMALIGVFASLSMGPLSNIVIGGMNIFDALGFFTDKILMPLSAMFMCIFVGHVWGVDGITEEIETGAKGAFKVKKAFGIILKYIAPVLILVILITGLLPS
ncbi:sodium-dependent transporter [Zongyangia hominis]|uniref:Transporter n=1 Tax=Zongyangia hominis TaxID=2763677 RepID=A0A926EDI5_9FIRM|nr:sodium-dependent transporter [Zongyangia hominis]MBC8571073.1 sodium-dependent transporter [Zongyangia hominis]